MKALHPHIKMTINRRTINIIFRTELEELTKFVKRIESISNNIKKIMIKKRNISRKNSTRFISYERPNQLNSNGTQSVVTNFNRSDESRDREKKNRDRDRS